MSIYHVIQYTYVLAGIALLSAGIYAFGLLVRFVRAQERAADALEELASRGR